MTTTRADRVALARKLRDEGHTLREIGTVMGMARTTVSDLLNDPDRTKQNRRRERYGAPCQRCGRRTNGSGGYAKRSAHCDACARAIEHEQRYWTPERVVEGLRKFAADHGRPPGAQDLLAAGVAEHGYPNCSMVQREFGTWKNGLKAAGFPPNRMGRKPIPTDTLIQQIRDASVNGVAPPCQPEMVNVYNTLRHRGITWQQACDMAGVQPRRTKGTTR